MLLGERQLGISGLAGMRDKERHSRWTLEKTGE